MTPRVVLLSVFDDLFLGLRSIGAYLKQSGVHVSYIAFRLPQDHVYSGSPDNELFDEEFHLPMSIRRGELDILIRLLERLKPAVIGITAVSIFHSQVRLVSRAIREGLRIPVIWGGTEAIVNPDIAMEEADMICTGEGEHAMLEVVNALHAGSGLESIQGIWWRDKNGEIRKNPPRAPIADLDTLPAFDWDLQDFYLISQGELSRGAWHPSSFMADGRRFHTLSGRGCPMHCAYCIHGCLPDSEQGSRSVRIRRRSVAHFINELRALKRRNPNLESLFFGDEIFTFSPPWIREFAPLYKKEINVPFVCYTYPKSVNRDVIRLLAEAGLRQILVGIQSASDHINKEVFGRPTSYQDILDSLHALHECGLDYVFELIGYNPYEREEDCLQTVRLLREMPRPATLAAVHNLTFFRHFALTDAAIAQGIPLQWTNPTTAMAPDRPEYHFWAALYYLLAAHPLSDRSLDFLLRERCFRDNPSALMEIARTFADSQFHRDHVTSREKKDAVIGRLAGELSRYKSSRAVRWYFEAKGFLQSVFASDRGRGG
ncbi:MAG: radical SAM protein [Candidatus Sumerlaeota bacterium]|nr:radical SAM protein [Candidatus Sumerlaeota bacterium]